MEIQLKAIPQAGEILRSECPSRPNVQVTSGGQQCFLGRNSLTQIADPAVSRRECALYIAEDGFLCLDSIKTAVWVNGMPLGVGMKQTLRHGDKVSLPNGKYRYEVVYPNSQPPSSQILRRIQPPQQRAREGKKRSASQAALAADKTPATPAAAASPSTLPQPVLDEFYCALCLDLQVCATTLVPCGHTFCQECVASVTTECPTCRGPFQTRVPCRPLDNIIAGLVSEEHFEADDVTVYEQRMGKAKAPATGRKRRHRAAASSAQVAAAQAAAPVEVICID